MISDHKFWAGGKGQDSVFPKGVHTKNESSAQGAGGISMYEDTTETIKKQQMEGIAKIHKHKMKDHDVH